AVCWVCLPAVSVKKDQMRSESSVVAQPAPRSPVCFAPPPHDGFALITVTLALREHRPCRTVSLIRKLCRPSPSVHGWRRGGGEDGLAVSGHGRGEYQRRDPGE